MPVQTIELEEVTMSEVSDDRLEAVIFADKVFGTASSDCNSTSAGGCC